MKSTHLKLAAIAAFAVAAILLCVWWMGSFTHDGSSNQTPVVFVGLDGVDWALLDPLMERRVMPNLARLVREGQGGTLASFHPLLSPLVWTTMMTGVSPLEHRILDFTRFNPVSGALEPITADERAVPAVWNMVQNGSVAILGMWATYPAEPLDGVLVSDRFFSLVPGVSSPSPASIHPRDLESWVRKVAEEMDASVDPAAMQEYLPSLGAEEFDRATRSPQPYSSPVSALRRILVETRTQARLSLETIERRSPRLLVAYYQGTDAIGHVFAPFAPPRQAGVTQEDFDRYGGVAELYFAEIDAIIGRYREIAEQSGAVLMLASDHGFLWHEGRPKEISSLAGPTAAKWHRLDGMYALWGPGVSSLPGHGGHGSVAQVCPTLLALLHLPPGKGLPESLLSPPAPPSSAAFDYRAAYRRVTTETAPAGADAAEQLEKLAALGYISGGARAQSASRRRAPGSTRTPASYNNEGLLLRAAGQNAAAAEAFEQALKQDPSYPSAAWNLSELLFDQGRELPRADDLLMQALSNGLASGVESAIGRAMRYQRTGKLDRAVAVLDRAIETAPPDSDLRLLRGRYRLEIGDCRGALSDFEAAAAMTPDSALAHASLGTACLCTGDTHRAMLAFERSLKLDPNQPEIRAYLHAAAASAQPDR